MKSLKKMYSISFSYFIDIFRKIIRNKELDLKKPLLSI